MAPTHPRLRALARSAASAVTVTATAAALAACSLVGAGTTHDSGTKGVVLVTHDSFVLPKALSGSSTSSRATTSSSTPPVTAAPSPTSWS